MSDNDLPSFGSNPLYRNGRVPTPSNSQGFLGGIDRAWDRFSKGLADSWANPDLSKLGTEPSSGKLLPSTTVNRYQAKQEKLQMPEQYGLSVDPSRQSPFADGQFPMSTPDSPNIDTAGMYGVPQGVAASRGVDAPETGKPANQMDWDAMAKHLASLSQNRAQGGADFAPYQPTGGWISLPDYAAQQNAEFDRRRMFDGLGISDREKARLMAQMVGNQENNATAREGHRMNYAAQMAGQGVTARGQDMNYAGHMAGVGVQGQNGLMSAMAHLYGAKAASDDRREMNRENIEAQAGERQSRADYYTKQGQLHERQIKEMDRVAAEGKDPLMLARLAHKDDMETARKVFDADPVLGKQMMAAAEERRLRAEFEAEKRRNSKANGGVVGYADGGAIANEPGGVTRQSIGGVDHISDPNAPGYRAGATYDAKGGYTGGTYAPSNSLGGQGGYGSFTNSAGQKFGDISGGAPIDQAMGANRDGLKTITENQQANAMGAFKNRAYAESSQIPGSDAYGREMLKGMNAALERSAARYDSSIPSLSENQYATGRAYNAALGNSNYGYASGGPIQVGGRQVLGPGTGKSDSIPAVIDGEQPAALSTGEFVMPVEAVQHFGLDRLNKMVAQARKGLDTGR